MKNNQKSGQEAKMKTATAALCRSLLDVSEAGEAEQMQRRARWFADPNLGLIHDKNDFLYPIKYGVQKRKKRWEKKNRRSEALGVTIRFFWSTGD